LSVNWLLKKRLQLSSTKKINDSNHSLYPLFTFERSLALSLLSLLIKGNLISHSLLSVPTISLQQKLGAASVIWA